MAFDGTNTQSLDRFVFHEVFLGRYTHARGQRMSITVLYLHVIFTPLYLGYRSQRAGADGGGVFTFSGGFAEAQRRQAENAARQAREHEEYKNRVREFGTLFFVLHLD
jgi:hypothetical protein